MICLKFFSLKTGYTCLVVQTPVIYPGDFKKVMSACNGSVLPKFPSASAMWPSFDKHIIRKYFIIAGVISLPTV